MCKGRVWRIGGKGDRVYGKQAFHFYYTEGEKGKRLTTVYCFVVCEKLGKRRKLKGELEEEEEGNLGTGRRREGTMILIVIRCCRRRETDFGCEGKIVRTH